MNPFEQEGNWYKANLHCHTTTSDGDSSVAERIEQYKEREYSVLAITDHGLTNDVSGLSSEEFLVISGMEMHPPCIGDGDLYHLVALNVPLGLEFPVETDANTRIERVKSLGGEVIFGHPYWCGHNINHLLALKDYIGIEVFNTTCTCNGKGTSSAYWDDLLDAGKMLPAVASDDTHYDWDRFAGWTMIRARELTVESVMDALRTGCFYASCGPVIEDMTTDGEKMVVRCSPAAEVHFMGQRWQGQSHYAKDGELITQAEFTYTEGLKYVRVEVVDSDGKRAWTNPIL